MSSRKALDLRTDGPPVATPSPAFLCVLCPVTTAFPPRAAVALPITFQHSEDRLQRNCESPASD